MGKRVLGICILAGLVFLPGPPVTTFTVVDVGQGDGMFIRTAAGHSIVIDGGQSGVMVQALQEEQYFDQTVDLLISTHFDADHAGGLIPVLQQFSILQVWMPDLPVHSDLAQDLMEAIVREGAGVSIVSCGQELQVDEVHLSVLSDCNPAAQPEIIDTASNDGALIIGVSIGTSNLLLTSDAPAPLIQAAWDEWQTRGVTAPLEIFKVGHHGSSTSTTRDLLKHIHPNNAVISVGAGNSYGHPTAQTLYALEASNIPYWRTDTQGSMQVFFWPADPPTIQATRPALLDWCLFLLRKVV